MKILWFANTPCGASAKLYPSLQVGGWLKSLEEQLVKNDDVELYVCFYWKEKLQPFQYNKTKYYPVYRSGNATKIGRILNRALHCDNDQTEVKNLLEVIGIIQPDVIHVHGTEDNFGLIQSLTKNPVVISIQGILSPYRDKFFSGIPLCSAFWHEGLTPKLLFRSSRFTYNELKKRADRERDILLQAKYIIGRTSWDQRVTRIMAPESHYFLGNEMLRSVFYQKKWSKLHFSTPIRIVTIMSSGLYKGLETIVNTSRILKESNLLPFE
ncbi:MAG TPA: hypothetical protein VI413_12630, partial [Paludibacter sp.]